MHSCLEKAVEVLKAAGAREVYVFGSCATGAMRDDSDVDLAVSGLLSRLAEEGMSLNQPAPFSSVPFFWRGDPDRAYE